MRRPSSRTARERGLRTRGYVSVAFGCPYAGEVAPEATADTAARLLDLGCDDISLGDTIGAATPADVERVLDAVLPVVPVDRLGLHAHDTRGQALANVLVALQRGITVIDSSAGGLGGCPFAGPGAAGNLATEDLVYFLDGMGIEHGVDLDAVLAASRSSRATSGTACAARRSSPAAGPSPARCRERTPSPRCRAVDTRHPETPMRRSVAPLLALTLLTLLVAPVAAKEWLEARFDAPIAMDTPGGTEILVGIMVTAPTEEGLNPVVGSPVYLKLTGRYGDTTRAAAAGDRTPGHYTVRIAIPAGGAREAEVGIHGTIDLPMMIMNDPFTFGPITARTSQLAPPLATPEGRAARGIGRAPAARHPSRQPRPAPAVPMAGRPRGARDRRASRALAVALIARRRHAAGPTPRSA